jgi:hypothetical protein
MRNLTICLTFLFFSFFGFSQQTANQTAPEFFAQCMLNITDATQLTALEMQLRSIPFVRVARVDIPTHRVFLVTKDVNSFTETEFIAWMGTYASNYTCLQIGLLGVDNVNPYPFTNCND